MAFGNRNKTVSGGTIERRHINLLRICIIAAVVLAFAVLLLQVISLFVSPAQEEVGLAFGAARRSFKFTPSNIIVFLFIPAIALALIWVYLKGYFKRNAHGSHLRIRYLDKHPRKKSSKYIHFAFIAAMMAASLALAIIGALRIRRIETHTKWDLLSAFIPAVVMLFILVGFYLHTSLMRKRKRIYSRRSHKKHSDVVGIESVEPEPADEEKNAEAPENAETPAGTGSEQT